MRVRPGLGAERIVDRAVSGLALLCLALGAPAPSLAAGPAPDVTLKVSTPDVILFEYHPAEPEIQASSTETGYEALRLSGAEVHGPPGSPALPGRRLAFGVPHGAEVELRVLRTGSAPMGSHRLLPVARWDRSPEGRGLGVARYEEDSALYGADAPYPDVPARIVLDSFFRGQRIVVVELVPFRYRPRSGDLEYLGPMGVALELGGGLPGESWVGPDLHESCLERELVNYESAKSWRRPGQRRAQPKRAAGFEQGTEWYKLGITEKGIYRVTGAMLAGAGLELDSVNPAEIRLFSGGGRALPETLDYDRVNEGWMRECSIWVRDGEPDGVLDEDDEIVFYGLGAQGWASDYDGRLEEEEWWRNVYTDTNVYWLAPSGSYAEPPRRMEARRRGWDAADVIQRTGSPQWRREEKNRIENFEIPYEDGWMWVNFDNATNERLIPLTTEDVDTTYAAELRVRLTGQKSSNHRHRATVSMNRVPLQTLTWSGEDDCADFDTLANLKEGENLLGIEVLSVPETLEVAQVTLAWIQVRPWQLIRLGAQVPVRSPDTTGVVEYSIELAESKDVFVFDVTDPFTPVRVDSVYISGLRGAFRDSASTDSTFRYVVAGEWKAPVYLLADEVSDLRTNTSPADLLVIYHPRFEPAAQSLVSHRQSEWRVRAVRIQDVYDEFSWGLFDPVAIRDFLAFATANYGAGKAGPGYALLLGDATYNYRAEGSLTIPNYVPSWHGRYRDGPNKIYSTDDWYAYLDPDDDLMDIAIGRLPVQTAEEAGAVVEKIVSYDESPEFGPWRARVVLAADDLGKKCVFERTEPWHTLQTDSLAVLYLPDVLTRTKIYLTEYPYVSCRKPKAEEDFRAALDEGALITLFIGHGDRVRLTDEELYIWRSAEPPENRGRPTFFIAGSCEVGDFSQPTGSSLGENLLRHPEGGAVAVFSSTYLAYPLRNYRLVRAMLASLFPGGELADGTLGAAVLEGKNRVRMGGMEGSLRFHNERLELLGDPTLRLGSPALTVEVSSADSDPIQFVRRDSVRVQGSVMEGGVSASGFDGTAWIEIRGMADTTGHTCVDHLGNPVSCPPTGHIDYDLPGRLIYRAPWTVEGGQFEACFFVPWDAEEGDLGWLSVYVSDGRTDGLGVVDSIAVGGMAPTEDLDGPDLVVSRDGNPVGDGSTLPPEGTLRFCFEDESGINIQGASDTSAVLLIVDSVDYIDLTDACEYEPGSFTSACVEYAYALDVGTRRLDIRATDNMGNRSSHVFNVAVVPRGELAVRKVFCYPNPFSEETYLLYELSREAEVTIRVFTVSGRLVRKLNAGWQSSGQQQIYWDGRDEDMDPVANGAYLFKVDVKSDGARASELGKAVRVR